MLMNSWVGPAKLGPATLLAQSWSQNSVQQ